jgi:hypothetical protein
MLNAKDWLQQIADLAKEFREDVIQEMTSTWKPKPVGIFEDVDECLVWIAKSRPIHTSPVCTDIEDGVPDIVFSHATADDGLQLTR